jgi:ribosome-associated heat shock protein Hsp15
VIKKEKLRIDKYLWSIRLFKTRSLAAEACEKGRIKLNGDSVKPAKTVNLNDEYEVKTEARKWVIRVTGLLETRQSYSEAIKHYEDITPPDELNSITFQPAAFNTGKRLSKVGRPTKKDRRSVEGFLEEDF